jgi:hypothetical protein
LHLESALRLRVVVRNKKIAVACEIKHQKKIYFEQ